MVLVANILSKLKSSTLEDYFYLRTYEIINVNFKTYESIENIFTDNTGHDEYILYAVKLYFSDNMLNKHVSITSEKSPESIFTRSFFLTKKQIKLTAFHINFHHLLQNQKNSSIYDFLTEELTTNIRESVMNVSDMETENNNPYPGIPYKENVYKVYMNIEENSHPTNSSYPLISLTNGALDIIFGIEFFSFIEHQNFDEFLTSLDTEIISNFSKLIILFRNIQDNSTMLMGDSLMAIIGKSSIHTTKMISYFYQNDQRNIKNYLKNKELTSVVAITPTVIKTITDTNDTNLNFSQTHYYKNILPTLLETKSLKSLFISSKHSFNFLGIKFMSISSYIQELNYMAQPETFLKLLRLKSENKYKFDKNICIPNLSINGEDVMVYDNEKIKELYKNLEKELNNRKISSILLPCSTESFEIYTGQRVDDPITDPVKLFHIYIKRHYIKKYASNTQYLLDIGAGHAKDLLYWAAANVKNVIGIEPSSFSVKEGNERIIKLKNKSNNTKAKLIEGKGEELWAGDPKYHVVNSLQNKFNVITLMFSIHYMLDNLNIMENIINSITKNGIVIILLHNSKEIDKKIMENSKYYKSVSKNSEGKYEEKINMIGEKTVKITYMNDVLFYLKDISSSGEEKRKIVTYMRGGYGLSKGSFEYLPNIDTLIKTFKSKRFNLLENKPFTFINLPEKNVLNSEQLSISSLYSALVFKKF